MPTSSFYVDGETYDTAEVISNDQPSSTTPSQAPSSFYPDGNVYTESDPEVADNYATQAAASAAAALASQNSAATSETNAASSATTASTQASSAATSAANAATSETNSASSEAAASASASAAATSETNAASSATTASTQAAAAATSAANAATSETNAAASAAAASTSETNAANSATAAATSAANAASAVQAAAGTVTPLVDGVAAVGSGTKWAREDHVHPTDTSRADASATTAALALKAPLASPALAGTPTAPTAAPGTNTTQVATTAFVTAAVSGAGVASLNGQTGTLTSYYAPQGRLTLQSVTPVMITTQSGKTTLYYTPYVGDKVLIYDGTNMVPMTFTELSIATTDTSKNPSAIGASKVNDWFIWNDSGTLRLSHGPDWTNDTTRGYSLNVVNGITVNASSITNGPAASRGTYVGTTRSNASSQLDWIFGASGTAPFFGVWNMYNRVVVSTTWNEGTASWSYNSTTVRALNATAKARVSFVRGLDEDGVQALAQTFTDTNSGSAVSFGWGLDSTSSNTTQMQATAPSVAGIGSVQYAGLPGSGFHYLQQTEKSSGAVSYTAYGVSTLSSVTFSGRM